MRILVLFFCACHKNSQNFSSSAAMLESCFSDQRIIIWVEVFVILMVQDSISDGVEASFYTSTKIQT